MRVVLLVLSGKTHRACHRYTCGSYQTTSTGYDCGQHECGGSTRMGKSVPAFPWPTSDPTAPPTGVAPRFAIVDKLRLPSDLKPGHYLLSWRWDCEETAQVWMVRERARLVRARACLCRCRCVCRILIAECTFFCCVSVCPAVC